MQSLNRRSEELSEIEIVQPLPKQEKSIKEMVKRLTILTLLEKVALPKQKHRSLAKQLIAASNRRGRKIV
jgi:hypothetical protein